MAKHYALVDEYGNRAQFVGDHLGQNSRGDDYYVKAAEATRTLLHVDHRDGSWTSVAPGTEDIVIRRLFADGERTLADRVADAFDREDIARELV